MLWQMINAFIRRCMEFELGHDPHDLLCWGRLGVHLAIWPLMQGWNWSLTSFPASFSMLPPSLPVFLQNGWTHLATEDLLIQFLQVKQFNKCVLAKQFVGSNHKSLCIAFVPFQFQQSHKFSLGWFDGPSTAVHLLYWINYLQAIDAVFIFKLHPVPWIFLTQCKIEEGEWGDHIDLLIQFLWVTQVNPNKCVLAKQFDGLKDNVTALLLSLSNFNSPINFCYVDLMIFPATVHLLYRINYLQGIDAVSF